MIAVFVFFCQMSVNTSNIYFGIDKTILYSASAILKSTTFPFLVPGEVFQAYFPEFFGSRTDFLYSLKYSSRLFIYSGSWFGYICYLIVIFY
jgi:hypothetical protein